MPSKIRLNLLFLILTILLFYLYQDISFLKKLLGKISIENSVDLKSICSEYFCRNFLYQYIKYIFFKFLSFKILIFFQIYLLIFSSFYLKKSLDKININSFFNWVIFVFLIINPKLLKYSFSIMEESIYIPTLILFCSFLINYLKHKNYSDLIFLVFFSTILLSLKSIAIFFYIFVICLIFLNLSKLKKIRPTIKLFNLIIILIIPFFLNSISHFFFKKSNTQNHYLKIHVVSSLPVILKNKKLIVENELENLIVDRSKKIQEIRKIVSNDQKNLIYFECVIFPAINNLIYDDPEIIKFFNTNKYNDINYELISVYFKSFLSNPIHFIKRYHKCFYANFIMAEFLTEEEYNNISKIVETENLEPHDKFIIKSFIKNSKNYFNIINYFRVIGIIILVTTLFSLTNSIYDFIIKKNKNYTSLLSIIFFLLFYLIINIHVNLVHVQSRWLFTYLPLLILSNLKILEYFSILMKKKFDRKF